MPILASEAFQHEIKQECIPVGCVPAAHRPFAGVFFLGGCLPGPGGVCLVLGGVWGLPGWGVGWVGVWWGVMGGGYGWGVMSGGVSAWSGGLPGPGESAWFRGSAWSWGGLPGPGRVGIPACTEADTLPACGQTHTCKNITLATTSLQPVIIQ